VQDKFGDMPIHIAAAKGHQSVVSVLATHEADLRVVDAQGRTPLIVAARNGHAGVVQLLLTKKCGLNNTNKSGAVRVFRQ
jgi:ankyrin repeat protein